MESAAGPKRGASGAQPLASRRASPRLAAASLPWAEQLDVHTAYQPALQPRPQDDVDFYLTAYSTHHGRPPMTLREDFCGTMLVSLAWVQSDAQRRACCVDLDPEVIGWAEEHNLAQQPPGVRQRLRVLLADVLALGSDPERFDIICANNYSHQCLKSRELMLKYLQGVRSSLAPGGLFVLDLCGGPECERNSYEELAESRVALPSGGSASYTYVYEQCEWKPETREQQAGCPHPPSPKIPRGSDVRRNH